MTYRYYHLNSVLNNGSVLGIVVNRHTHVGNVDDWNSYFDGHCGE